MTPLGRDHIDNPRNVGPLETFTHYGYSGTVGESPCVQLWLNVVDEVVESAAYVVQGQDSLVALASLLCEIAVGRPAADAFVLTVNDLLVPLGLSTDEDVYFAQMCLDALQRAFLATP